MDRNERVPRSGPAPGDPQATPAAPHRYQSRLEWSARNVPGFSQSGASGHEAP